jgi:hypothetical protein
MRKSEEVCKEGIEYDWEALSYGSCINCKSMTEIDCRKY